ncbi:sensor histidine kinase [Pseudonocardia sp. GCM10023141]|uniref:sensor histidine kinase n=1 Tax=Pseudonocardia sp. GCM10023141 TaxID=3252653 RepID=UPI0036216456
MTQAGRLRSYSLRARVTALSMLVLAAVLIVVGVLTDVIFAAQSRVDMRNQLALRAQIATSLQAEGYSEAEILDRLRAPGIRAAIVDADGATFGDPTDDPGPPRPRRGPDDEVLRQPLDDGAQLTLVASAAPTTDAQDRLRRTLLLLSIGALAVGGIVTMLTTRFALAPLDAMTALARSITRGDRGRRLAPARTDTELGRAAAAFDDMLDELEGAERQARGSEQAALASEARTRRFVADAAHELRTPLAGVQAVAEAAMAPELPADERERLHLLLLRESHRAGRLVDDLLAMARIDAGIELRREPVELLGLARAEADRVRLLDPERTITVDGAAVTVAGDAARLGQVLANLLDNARRYAATSGQVAVQVGAGRMASVLVTDTGPGVPAGDRGRIFDRLVRLDEARTAHDGGAGLGLAIARGIARAHGGDLRCVDPPGGAGAAFELTLPL